MIDKKYLEKLKKEDYIAWDELVNDSMHYDISYTNFVLIFIVLVVIVGSIIYINI